MSQDIFNTQLEWANDRGLFLHSGLERKSENHTYGMYATAPIKANTLLASFPVKELPANKKKILKEDIENVGLNWIYAAAKEFNNEQSQTYKGIFAGFDRLEDMRRYASYFCSEEELNMLRAMSPLLFRWVMDATRKADATINKIHKYDPSLDREVLLTIYLNYRSRGFYPQGVIPVLDQFNHSDLYGQPNTMENGKLCVYSKKDLSAGEQVFISYGPKDLYSHAINYHYFDPAGPHLLALGRKTIQSVQNKNDFALLAHLKKHFKVNEFVNGKNKGFFVSDPSVMLIEGSLTEGAVSYLKETCRVKLGAKATEQELMRAAAEYFVFLIDRQLQMNKVYQFEESAIPDRLQRFYHLLRKERAMLIANRERTTGKATAQTVAKVQRAVRVF